MLLLREKSLCVPKKEAGALGSGGGAVGLMESGEVKRDGMSEFWQWPRTSVVLDH